jgi:hypothetical protein
MADPLADERPGGPRLAALAIAVVLVLVAVVVRGRLDGDDTGSGGGSNGDLVLVCPTDLGDLCEATLGTRYQVRVEDPVTTRDALIEAPTADAVVGDLWLVPAPWAEAVGAQRERDRVPVATGEATAPLGRSPVLLAVSDERATALENGPCGGQLTWTCLGDATGRPWSTVGGQAAWGTVKAGLSDPTSAMGLPVLGAATAGYVGTFDYATNEITGTLMSWLAAFAAYPAATNAVDVMLTEGAGRYFAVGALEVTARKAAGRPGFRVVVPDDVITADLVVVPIGRNARDRDGADDLAGDDVLLDALASAGWRVEGRDLAPGVDPGIDLPREDNLPSGDVLRPLLSAWQDLE